MGIRVDIAVWPLDGRDAGRAEALLSGEERARAARFLAVRDRERYVLAHAGLRILLGRRTGRPPASLRLVREEGGKPRLADAPGLAFSLSHSDGHAALAIASGWPVGIDLEAIRPIDEGTMLRALSRAEGDRLLAMPPAARQEAFFAFWTRKEAVAKATGQGFGIEPAAIETGPGPAAARVEVPGQGAWRVVSLTADAGLAPPAGFAMAVAVPDGAGAPAFAPIPGPGEP